MNIVRKFLGPLSKFDKSLPYTYEARVPIIEGEEVYNTYFSDMICGLVEYLQKNGIEPESVNLFEIYQNQEFPLDKKFCTTSDDKWLFKPHICCSFREHYKGHIQEGKCDFKDRNREGCGP